MHQNRSIQSAQPSVRSSQLLQLLLAEAKLLRIHVPQARHVLRFQSRERTALYKSMLGFAATLDHVRPDLSDRERLRYSVRWCAWAWQSKHKAISFCSVPSLDWLRNLLWWTSSGVESAPGAPRKLSLPAVNVPVSVESDSRRLLGFCATRLQKSPPEAS